MFSLRNYVGIALRVAQRIEVWHEDLMILPSRIRIPLWNVETGPLNKTA
jgi:hypothetical protein